MSDRPFLLRLPHSVRCKIYLELGIIRHEPVDLSRRPLDGEWSCREQKIRTVDDDYPWRRWIANQLFYVSRAVSEDSRAVFYSANKFEFARHIVHGLKDIRGFGPLAWRSFRYLSFALDQTYHYEGNEYGAFKYDDFFWERSQDVSEVLPDWRYICEQLAAYNTFADRLELRFICDAATKKTAAEFLNPLKSLPLLKELAIQIGPFWNPGIQEMITASIREKTKPRDFPGAFRFSDLPVEIQYRILEHTDLVISRPLEYSSPRGTFLLPHTYNTYSRDPRKDFCPGHAALPCLRTPHMLFLVSKPMRQLALSIFYSQNVFQVRCEPKSFAPAAGWGAHRSGFLHGFPVYSFHYLRHIHWRLPSMWECGAFRPGSSVAEDWVISLYLLSLAVPPGRLTIELTMSPYYGRSNVPETASEFETEWEPYDRVVGQMGCLKGLLRDLFIHMYYPSHSSLEEIRVAKEQSLEKHIMGSDYDSSTRGKKPKRI
ncbi:hypothetical protein BDV10DRAFT_183746 [Aspergillus recurvatus]